MGHQLGREHAHDRRLPGGAIAKRRQKRRRIRTKQADRAAPHAQRVLRGDEDIVPEPGFEMVLEFRQVEIGAGARARQRLVVVGQKDRKVEQRTRDRLAVDVQMFFRQVPAARAHDQCRRARAKPVRLATARIDVADFAVDGVAQIDLAVDHVLPGRGGRILEIGHERLHRCVERIDDHLAIDRPGDFYASIQKIRRHRRNAPGGGACRGGFRQEFRQCAGIQLLLPLRARGSYPWRRASRSKCCAKGRAFRFC